MVAEAIGLENPCKQGVQLVEPWEELFDVV